MEGKFADRIVGVTGSAIREIFKLVQSGNVISFAGGNPSPASFPSEVLAQISGELISKNGDTILQYGRTEGYAPLVESIGMVVAPRGVHATDEGILPLTGSTQGIELFCKLFINPGDAILVESPTFLGALQTFTVYQANIVPVATDEGGMVMEDLEEKIRTYRPKFLYTIPTFQNPLGVCLTKERRAKVAELSHTYGLLVLEDDPYCELRYDGEALPAIKSFPGTENVVHLMSFSKTVSPGLRLGGAIGDPAIIRKMVIAKQGSDVHTSNLTQAMVDEYVRRGYYFAHVQEILPLYREQLGTMLEELALCPPEVSYTRPSGGLFVWVELPEERDAFTLLERAVKAGVAYVPGIHFYPRDGKKNTLRLNFSSSTPQQIREGMGVLRELFQG